MGIRKAYIPATNETSYVETERVTVAEQPSLMEKKGAKTALSIGGVVSALAAAAPLLAKLPLGDLAGNVKDSASDAKDKSANATARGIDKSVNKVADAGQSATGAVGTANDKMHDMIESLLGTISEKLDNLPSQKDEMLKSTPLLKDTKTAKAKKGTAGTAGLITLGLLALAGAAAAYMMSQQKRNDDPWAVSDEELDTTYRSQQGEYPAQVVTTTRTEAEPTTIISNGPDASVEMGGADATIDERLLANNDVSRQHDALNPIPQGYDNGVDNRVNPDNNRI